jgi:tRNA (cmo5U34)-methyltransferase
MEYDENISLFSLRREERLGVMIALLPMTQSDKFRVLELGAGTGIVTERLARHYPSAQITAVDGAQKMIDRARSKPYFRKHKGQVQWILADYSRSDWMEKIKEPQDLAVSFDSLHHLCHERHEALYEDIFEILSPGGKMIVSDHMPSLEAFSADPQFHLWIAEIRKEIARRETRKIGPRLKGLIATLIPERLEAQLRHDFSDEFVQRLKNEGENPMPVMRHVDVLRRAGFVDVTIVYRFASFAMISSLKDPAAKG